VLARIPIHFNPHWTAYRQLWQQHYAYPVQVISVEDTTAPVWDQVMPVDITVECDGVPAAPAVVTASDNCDADVLVEFTEVRTDGVLARIPIP
jgi:hypothetical protein